MAEKRNPSSNPIVSALNEAFITETWGEPDDIPNNVADGLMAIASALEQIARHLHVTNQIRREEPHTDV